MRQFETGATRDSNTDKHDYRGFLSPKAIKRFGAYMHKHRIQADGKLRDSDNWKKGMPIPAYVESLVRHVVEFWDLYEDGRLDDADEVACAILFNVQGYLHERAKGDVKAIEVERVAPGVAIPREQDELQELAHGEGFGYVRVTGKMGT